MPVRKFHVNAGMPSRKRKIMIRKTIMDENKAHRKSNFLTMFSLFIYFLCSPWLEKLSTKNRAYMGFLSVETYVALFFKHVLPFLALHVSYESPLQVAWKTFSEDPKYSSDGIVSC